MLCMHMVERQNRSWIVHKRKCLNTDSLGGGVGIWANLLSSRCVMLDMPEKHVELLAMPSHARTRRFCGLRHCDHVRTESRSMTNVLVRSRLAVRRKVGSASDLGVESCPRHIQHVEASLAIPTAVISIFHWRMSLEAPKNGTHDRTGEVFFT